MWDEGYVKPGKRILNKKSYKDMDWNNKKEITAWEIAYCIYTFSDITIKEVPEGRLISVKNVLKKRNEDIQGEKKKEYSEKQKQIKSELAIYKHIDDGTTFGKDSDEVVGYFLDSKLFKTVHEASAAMSELMICNSYISKKIMDDDFKYKDKNIYDRDKKRMLDSLRRTQKMYMNLGGKEEDFKIAMKSLPIPDYSAITFKQDMDSQREHIITTFLSIGVEKTRARKIAKAITTKAYEVLKDTVRL